MATTMIEIVSATQHPLAVFAAATPLGLSLARLFRLDPRYSCSIACENHKGLSEVYNDRIFGSEAEILVFIHDDVWIDGDFLADQVIDGLKVYDVLGVAGNKRIVKNQPGWVFLDDNFTWDDRSNLSGSVAHGPYPFGDVSNYGSAPAACELLDGVFLAARRQTLIDKSVFFDPTFDFHFYDLDFCRTARRNGLSLGTCLVKITHRSGGRFNSQEWKNGLNKYRKKWKG
jgi:hypothetical protein